MSDLKRGLALMMILFACAHSQPDTATFVPAQSDSSPRFADRILDRMALGANYYALTYHPGGGGARYPREFDDKAYWVLQVGAEGYADYSLKPWILLRASGSLYKDCADVWAGFAHFGFRVNWAPAQRLVFRIGIGPSFLWRQSWLGRVKGYRSDDFFGRPDPGDRYQSRWIWYGGNVETEFKLKPRLGLVYSLVPGFPFVMTSSLGLRAGF